MTLKFINYKIHKIQINKFPKQLNKLKLNTIKNIIYNNKIFYKI